MDPRSRRLAVVALTALAVGTGLGRAQAPESKHYSPSLEEMRETIADRLQAVADKLGLTDEQRTKIRESNAAFADKVKGLRTQRHDLMMDELKALGEALTPEQREKAKAYLQERAAAAREGTGRHDWPDVGYARGTFPEMMQAAADKLGLTREQRMKMKETHAAYRDKYRTLSGEARDLVEAQVKALGGILTDEQRAKARGFIEGRMVRAAAVQSVEDRLRAAADKLGLSPEQRTKIKDILGSYHEKYETLADERREVMQEELKAVAAVLTEEQRQRVRDFCEDKVVVIGVDVDPSKPEAVAQLKETIAERFEAVADRLGLSEEQRTKIREVHAGFEAKYQAQRVQRRELRERELKDVAEVLTAEQREKVRSWVEDRIG